MDNDKNNHEIEEGEYCWFDVLGEESRNSNKQSIDSHSADCNNDNDDRYQQHQQYQQH